jgi:hypothetical protein
MREEAIRSGKRGAETRNDSIYYGMNKEKWLAGVREEGAGGQMELSSRTY